MSESNTKARPVMGDNNPKTRIGATKVPLHLVPPSAKHYLAEALADGGKKYGPYNWRGEPISISTYYAAANRHMDAYWDGEDVAPDSGVHHVAHAMACMALILDCYSQGTLVDDRPERGASPSLQRNYAKAYGSDPSKLDPGRLGILEEVARRGEGIRFSALCGVEMRD